MVTLILGTFAAIIGLLFVVAPLLAGIIMAVVTVGFYGFIISDNRK